MAAAAAASIVLAALGACSRNRPPRRPGEEYLKDIDVEGNRQVKERHLVAGLALQRAKDRSRPPDPYLVQLDEERIRGEYLRRGFLGIDVRSRVDREGDAATVVYTVEEGQRARTRVVIRGIPADDPDLSVSKVREVLPLEDGAPFDYAVYEEAKPLLLGVAQNAGYAHARLDSTIYADRANRLAIVQLDYRLGPKCTFGPIEISGVTGDLADAVRARAQFKPGDRYSTQAIAETQRQLYAMARFSTVQVLPAETTSPVVGVRIAVAQAAPREIRLGGGFGADPTAYEARARIGYTIAGWPFPLDTATIDLRPAYAYMQDGSGFQPRIRALARIERQDLFWTYGRGEIEGGFNYVALEPYTTYGPRARVGYLTPVKTERVQLGVGWQIERLSFRDISELLGPEPPNGAPSLLGELGLDRPQRVGAYTGVVTVDLRDHPIEPTRGAYAGLRSSFGTRFAGGAFDFVQLVPELRGYVPLGPVVLGARVRAGTFFGEVPATERFFAGGASSHRGFGERRLAPTRVGDIEGKEHIVPFGGESMLESSVEARFPIATWREIGIGGVLFLDGGDVREELADIALRELHWAAGVGLRFRTIVGPIRADLGYRLNRIAGDDRDIDNLEPAGSRFAFHLSLGEAF